MNKRNNEPPKIKSLLTNDFNDLQKEILVKIFNKLWMKEFVKVKDIQGLIDLNHLRHQQFINITGLFKTQIVEMTHLNPTIKNPDGTYSLTNLLKYLRSKEYRKNTTKKEEEKITEEERNLTARERIDQAKAIQEEVKASKVQDETITVEEHKKILTTRFINLIDFIKINFECKFKELANKDEDEIKILGKKLMKELLTAYCSEYSSTEEDENE
jgi:hypothetical protein